MSRFLILHIRAGTARQKIDDSDFLQKKSSSWSLHRKETIYFIFMLSNNTSISLKFFFRVQAAPKNSLL